MITTADCWQSESRFNVRYSPLFVQQNEISIRTTKNHMISNVDISFNINRGLVT